jgi:hypothetical protein
VLMARQQVGGLDSGKLLVFYACNYCVSPKGPFSWRCKCFASASISIYSPVRRCKWFDQNLSVTSKYLMLIACSFHTPPIHCRLLIPSFPPIPPPLQLDHITIYFKIKIRIKIMFYEWRMGTPCMPPIEELLSS